MEFDTAVLASMGWQLVNIMLPIIVALIGVYGQKWGSAFVAKKRLELTAEQNARIDKAINFCMVTAEQLKINGILPDGEAAKNWVINQAQTELKKYNIPVDVAELADKIEGNYNNMLVNGIPDKQALISQAIDAGVAAYKDSGTSDEVKKLVADFSKKYLAEFGVTVNAEVLEGLALSKLNALK
jgi:hypothetical protein